MVDGRSRFRRQGPGEQERVSLDLHDSSTGFCQRGGFRLGAGASGEEKPDLPLEKARFWRWEEGLCAHVLHIGPYDAEPASIDRLSAFIAEQGCENDFSDTRRHHEIYLGDPRRTAPEKLKTVIRHPIRKTGGNV